MENSVERKNWNLIAKDWSKYRKKISPTVLDFLKDKKGKVLDLGCGSGRNFVKLDGIEWYGSDFSSEMIKYAKTNAENKNIYANLKRMEAKNLKYDDDFFDCILCVAVLHCIKKKKDRIKVIEEIKRVLKKGGQVYISCWGKNSKRIHNKGKECFVPWTTDKLKNKTLKRYTYVYDLNELKDDVNKCGLKIIKSFEERNVNVFAQK